MVRGDVDNAGRPLARRTGSHGRLYLAAVAVALASIGAGLFAMRHEVATTLPPTKIPSDVRLFSKNPSASDDGPSAAFTSARVRLLGVVASNRLARESLAVIEVNERGPRLFQLGDQIEPGLVLAEINQSFIVVSGGGNRRAIEIEGGSQVPISSAGESASPRLLAGSAAGGYVSAAPALPESNQPSQPASGAKLSAGSEAFIKAIREVSKRANEANK